MSLYGAYIKEREDFDIIENEFGFITFQSDKDCMFLRDMYIIPEKRGTDVFTKLHKQLEDLAKERNCKYILTQIVAASIGSTHSMKAAFKTGYTLMSSTNERIFLRKEL